MKKAVVKIIVWSVVAVVLTAALVFGLNRSTHPLLSFLNTGIHLGSEWKDATVGGGSVSAEGIQQISIDWSAGSVTVQPGSGDQIVIRETAGKTLSDDEMLRYVVSGGELKIIDRASSWQIFTSGVEKALTVELPVDAQTKQCTLEKIDIDTASAEQTVSQLNLQSGSFTTASGSLSVASVNAENLKISTVSGRTELNTVVVPELKINSVSGEVWGKALRVDDMLSVNTVSGGINLTGEVRSFDADSTSGQIRLEDVSLLEKADVNTVSGDTELILHDCAGFTAKFSTVSGDFSSGLPTTTADKRYVYGDGSASFDFDSTSGSVRISGDTAAK